MATTSNRELARQIGLSGPGRLLGADGLGKHDEQRQLGFDAASFIGLP